MPVQGRFVGVPGFRAAEVSFLSQRDQLAQLMPFWWRKFSQVSLSWVNTPPLPSARLVPHSLTRCNISMHMTKKFAVYLKRKGTGASQTPKHRGRKNERNPGVSVKIALIF